MGVENQHGKNIERTVWRGGGIVFAVEAVRLLATLPQPTTESDALMMMGLGLLIPTWVLWGHGSGWLKEDLSTLRDIVTGKEE